MDKFKNLPWRWILLFSAILVSYYLFCNFSPEPTNTFVDNLPNPTNLKEIFMDLQKESKISVELTF